MYRDKKIIAIIPARGGSKRLPGKNIKELNGKPLIAWTIEAALKSNLFDEVMVNTDDQDIANVAKAYNASIPFLRDNKLATDTASSLDVVIQTINFYREKNREFDIAVLLQPTSPLRDFQDIINAVDIFINTNASSVLTVCEVDHPVQWCNTLDNSLSMDSFIKKEFKGLRSQDLEINYRLNGAVYVWNINKFIEKKESIISPSFASIMDRERSVDIDEEIDFVVAEKFLTQTQLDVPFE